MKGVWKRRGRTLMPASAEADQTLASVRDGAECMGEFYSARRPKQHRTFFKLLAVLVDHDVFPTKEGALDALKIGCGHVTTIIMPDSGHPVFTPKSIAFESMAQADFTEFMRAAVNVICDRWLVDSDHADVLAAVYEILDGPEALGTRTFRDTAAEAA